MEVLPRYLNFSRKLFQRILDWSVPYRKIRWFILISLTFQVIYQIIAYDYLAILFFWSLYFLYLIVQYFTPSGLPDPDQDDTFLLEKKNTMIHQYEVSNNQQIQSSQFIDQNDVPGYIQGIEQMGVQMEEQGEERPLLRTITQFTLWKSAMCTLIVSWLCTFSDVFLIPVYWPFLLIYFIWLIGLAVHKHIKHMKKYGYRPSDFLIDKQKISDKEVFG